MSCLETIKENGLRLTPQRRLIAEIIHSAPAHLRAEDIITQVQKKMPRVNKSTIYRTLDLLENSGCVVKSEAQDHFIYHHAEEGHHHHLVCRRCGKTLECAESVFAPIERAIAKQYAFSVDFKHLVIAGLCADCAK